MSAMNGNRDCLRRLAFAIVQESETITWQHRIARSSTEGDLSRNGSFDEGGKARNVGDGGLCRSRSF
jgi:hypothetical protein